MKTRTNYGEIADGIDYAKLDKKLDELRKQEPPKKRRRAADLLAPVRDKLLELHTAGLDLCAIGRGAERGRGSGGGRDAAGLPGRRS